MTGSLYGIRNVYKALAKDDEWFTLHVTVRKPRVADPRERHAGRRLDRAAGPAAGGRAEAEPPRPRHVRPAVPRPGEQGLLPQPAGASRCRARPAIAAPMPLVDERYVADARARPANFPLVDLHAHLKGGLTLEQALALSRGTGMFLGLAVNCGKGFPDRDGRGRPRVPEDDGGPAGLRRRCRPRAASGSRCSRRRRGRSSTTSSPTAMTWTNPAGKRMRLWIPEEVEIGPDEQAFMDLLVSKIVGHPRDGADRHLRQRDVPAGGDRRRATTRCGPRRG